MTAGAVERAPAAFEPIVARAATARKVRRGCFRTTGGTTREGAARDLRAGRPQRRPERILAARLPFRHKCGRLLPRLAITFGAVPGSLELSDHDAMGLALDEAALAPAHGDVPVAAVALVDGAVIARRHNEREVRNDPIAHAEVLALRDAAEALGSWRLSAVTLVVTLEPCPMCAGALVAARVGRVVFGTPDPKAGACGSLYNLCVDPRLNHEIAVTAGVRQAECSALLTTFFEQQRAR